jgi:hypothetical protein
MQVETPPVNEKRGGCSTAPICSTFVRMFKPQFAPLVISGQKCQTIRPTPKRIPKRGDKISLRMWTGKPYRSKQRVLRDAVVDWVQPARIFPSVIELDGQPLSEHQMWAFAKADGFNTPQDMIEWFAFTHGLPFEGIVIYWSNC